MNKKNYMGLSFICLIKLLTISSSYAEGISDTQASNEILTQAELSQCQEKTKSLAQTAKQLNERSSQLNAEKNDLSQLESDRSQIFPKVNFHSQASVDKYNRINKQLKQLSQQYTIDAESFNNAVRQYKIDIEQHIIECDDKHYYKQ